MTKCGFASSNGEAKRLVQQGGVSVNDQAVSTLDTSFTKAEAEEGLKVRKGKRHFKKVILA